MISECSISAICTITCWILIKSRYQAVKGLPELTHSQINSMDYIRHYFKNSSALVILISFSTIIGSFIYMMRLIAFVTLASNFDEIEYYILLSLFLLGSVSFAMMASIWTDRKQRYKFSIIASSFLSGSFSLILYYSISLQSILLTSTIIFMQGACMFPIAAIAQELMIEVTYPNGESYAQGILISACQVIAIVL